LGYGNLRRQAKAAGQWVVKGCRRCGNLPAVPCEACAYGIMIVTNQPPRRKRPKKPAQPVAIKVPRVVQHLPKWKREPKPRVRDPEAEAQVEAVFLRMGAG
jgi:hypothetical protein